MRDLVLKSVVINVGDVDVLLSPLTHPHRRGMSGDLIVVHIDFESIRIVVGL